MLSFSWRKCRSNNLKNKRLDKISVPKSTFLLKIKGPKTQVPQKPRELPARAIH
jgi:hypothetical protein